MTPRTDTAASNFLVPNATFIVEVVAFVLIVWVLAKYVVPIVNKAMTDRQESIRNQFAELEQAKARAEATENEYRSQLVEARHEAARIREQAREDGASILADLRDQAQAEHDRILNHAQQQMHADRQQVVQQLRLEVGSMATSLAERIVGESLDDDERRARTVERFVADLESADSNGTSPKVSSADQSPDDGAASHDDDSRRGRS